MFTFPNGNQYKLLLIDTNILSNICKNKNGEKENFISRFIDKKYAPCIAFQSILEIYNAEPKGKSALFESFIKVFSEIPTLLLYPYRSLTYQEIEVYLGKKNEIDISSIINAFSDFGKDSISEETKSALKLSANPKKVTPQKTKPHSPNNSKRQNSLNTAKSIFNALWIFAKGLFRVLWQAAQVLFVIATLIFAFLDGLFFHKIRMQGIRKRAAQKAAQTRKRNAPYKPSKRSRHYNLK